MLLPTLDSAAQVATLAGIAMTASGVIVRWSWRAYRKSTALLNRILTGIDSITVKVEAISQEVHVNGGSSLKDRVMVLGNEVKQLHHEVRVSTAARRLSDHRATCEMIVDGRGDSVAKYVSPKWTEMTGVSRETMANDGWATCIRLDHRPRVVALAETAAKHHALFEAEYPLVHDDQWVRHVGYPILTDLGTLIGWVGELTSIPAPEDTE
jgi:PAS domain-containing protein